MAPIWCHSAMCIVCLSISGRPLGSGRRKAANTPSWPGLLKRERAYRPRQALKEPVMQSRGRMLRSLQHVGIPSPQGPADKEGDSGSNLNVQRPLSDAQSSDCPISRATAWSLSAKCEHERYAEAVSHLTFVCRVLGSKKEASQGG
ncbi:hypothetical protein B0T24DRAFT_593120 [Lasiosphaeria ovina]|uniref:Uncharacterized protein n=1 Tax=Lasiosphaeria ovina TaxID=92902 RepID=A0AAE0K9Y6_9PEZI|nr:hypothetical protein B0T24DRAFT_593120 [Lasiosphaeria ovina]